MASAINPASVAAACGGGDDTTDSAGDGGGGASTTGACADADTAAGDLLAQVCSEGIIRVSTDPTYPSQSSLDPETGEYVGFDIDVATEIAERLGVSIEWETPKWEAITAGNWQGRWDMSVGSMTVTAERTEVLDFTPAYYFTPASIAVPEGSDISTVEGLNGKTVGVCSGCTYDFFLQGTLDIPGFEFPPPPAGISIKGFDTDSTQDHGRFLSKSTSSSSGRGQRPAPGRSSSTPSEYRTSRTKCHSASR